MDIKAFLIFLGIVVVLAIIWGAINAKKQRKTIESRLSKLANFSPTQTLFSVDIQAVIALDETRGMVCLMTNKNGAISERLFPYTDILSVEVFEDGISVTKTVRSSQIGGVIVGGLLLGGVGAIIGGLSGKTTTSGKIQHVDLRLIVNDTKSPTFDVRLMALAGKKDGALYKDAIKNARHWHGVFEVLIKRADAEAKREVSSVQVAKQGLPKTSDAPIASVADELKKLAELRSSGVLSDAEFIQQKSLLLGHSSRSV